MRLAEADAEKEDALNEAREWVERACSNLILYQQEHPMDKRRKLHWDVISKLEGECSLANLALARAEGERYKL